MRAVTYDSYASDDSKLHYGEVADPKVGPGQVLIQVKAASVNPVDWKVMAGGLDPMMDSVFPVIPGWDVAGVVTRTGPDTPEFSVGDEVLSYARKDVVGAGTFAEYVAVAAPHVARKPAGLDWPQAGGLPLAGLSALRCMDRLGIGAGDVLLVHGAAGGVGSIAVQLGVALGARVIGTASERNHEFVRGLGGEPVAYGEGVVDRIKALSPSGVTAVADFVGGQLETTLAVLASGGRHVSIADPTVGQHGGEWLWVRPDGAKLAELAAFVDAGRLTVEVAETYPLDKVAAAFEASRGGHTRGKLVIVP
jgi:NADPH:quinone reductase-like Zn-dependent oxidoreductase